MVDDNMKDKHGFTLVELMVVIALIAVLMVLFMPNLLGVDSSTKKNIYNKKVETAEIGAKSFINDNKNYIKNTTNNKYYCVTISFLIKEGYLVSDGVDGAYYNNPLTNDKMDGYIILKYENLDNVLQSIAKYTEVDSEKNNCNLINTPIKDQVSERYSIIP